MVIGLTGGIGSGKSTAAQFFRALNVTVIDADQIARQLVEPHQPAFQAIVDHFGSMVLDRNGHLNRRKLRSVIFGSPTERAWLEQLLHPLIKEAILTLKPLLQDPGTGHSKVKEKEQEYMIVEIPLLFEANFENVVDRILVIHCSEATQLERVMKRDALPVEAVHAIIKTQASVSTRLSLAHDVIENEGSRGSLQEKIAGLHSFYKTLPAALPAE